MAKELFEYVQSISSSSSPPSSSSSSSSNATQRDQTNLKNKLTLHDNSSSPLRKKNKGIDHIDSPHIQIDSPHEIDSAPEEFNHLCVRPTDIEIEALLSDNCDRLKEHGWKVA